MSPKPFSRSTTTRVREARQRAPVPPSAARSSASSPSSPARFLRSRSRTTIRQQSTTSRYAKTSRPHAQSPSQANQKHGVVAIASRYGGKPAPFLRTPPTPHHPVLLSLLPPPEAPDPLAV